MTPVLAIAQVTYREAVRNRVLYSLLFFVAALLVVSAVLDRMTMGQSGRVVLDLGLAAIHGFGALIAVFLGVSLMSREVARKTLHVVLAKPVGRTTFLLGKYLGLAGTLGVIVGVMGAALMGVCAAFGHLPGAAFLLAVGMIWVELVVLTGVAILFAAFTGPFLSGMFTLGIFVIGHLTPGLKELGASSGDPFLSGLAGAIYYAVPNLEVFDFKVEALYRMPVSGPDTALALAYALGYAVLLLAAAGIVFARRDFR
jgi:ABC-type transport system involved in multi-copper enzyme maturation permease subunit